MDISSIGRAHRPGDLRGSGLPSRKAGERPADRAELSAEAAQSRAATETRAQRLEILREAIAAGRYSLPEATIARAIIQVSRERDGRSI